MIEPAFTTVVFDPLREIVLELKFNVPVNPESPMIVCVTFWTRVTVPPPEFALKKTASTATGTDAPPAPPEVADQLAVFTKSQVPVPPTQKRFAII
jgi:hypothetical protein